MDDGQEILVVGEQTVFTLKDWVLSDHLFSFQDSFGHGSKWFKINHFDTTQHQPTFYNGFVLVLAGPFLKGPAISNQDSGGIRLQKRLAEYGISRAGRVCWEGFEV